MSPDRKVCDMTVALKRMGNNAQLLREVIELVRADMPDVVRQLRAAVDGSKPVEVERAAHSLQGMAVTFGADAALFFVVSLKEMAQAGDLSRAANTLEYVEREISRLDVELTAELARPVNV